MTVRKKISNWYRDASERQRVRDPLRIRMLMRSLWPWYLPLWVFPVVFISACFLGYVPQESAVSRGLFPFIGCALVFLIPTWKADLSWRETIFFVKLIPLCLLVGSGIVWAIVHDNYLR